MADAPLLRARARVPLPDPDAMLHRLCEHFVAHGVVTRRERGGRIENQFGHAELELEAGALRIEAAGVDRTALYVVKMALAEHIFEMADGEPPAFQWTGDADAEAGIPFFREMTVRGARNVTRSMRRVTLAGADVEHFASGGLHARVLMPPAGREPRWPIAAADGRVIWPKGKDELTGRVYTIRRVDPERGELDIDVVLHDDPGAPGSNWAATAAPGDRVGLMGPGGGEIVTADWYLLAGDETALPVIARIAESLPPTAKATALIEVEAAADEQPLTSAADIETTWLHRGDAAPGTTRLLETAIRDVTWPAPGVAAYALVGCEQAAARSIRILLRKERGMGKKESLVAAYWRRGTSGGEVERDT